MLHNDKDLFERVVLDTSEKYGIVPVIIAVGINGLHLNTCRGVLTIRHTARSVGIGKHPYGSTVIAVSNG